MPLIQSVLILAVVGTIEAGFLPMKARCMLSNTINLDSLDSPVVINLKPNINWNTFTITEPVTEKPPPAPAPACQRRVCFFPNWSQHQAGAGFPPKDFDASLCTHVICSHGKIWEHDFGTCGWSHCFGKIWMLGFDHKVKHQVNALKKKYPHLKVLASVPVNSRIIKAMSKQFSGFSDFAIDRVVASGFDGLDLYFPASSKSLDQDKIHNSRLIEELRVRVKHWAETCPTGETLLMTATLPADKATVHSGFDIPSLSRDLDFVNLRTYDSPEDSDVKWRHIFLLFGEAENDREHHVDFYVRSWIEKGFPKDKIVVGIQAYGSSVSRLSMTQEATHDYVTYNEVCKMIQDGVWHKRLLKEKVPYMTHGSKLVFYDDPQSVAAKVKYVKAKGYGGVMVRSLNDFNSTACKTGKYPLLNALKQECSNEPPK